MITEVIFDVETQKMFADIDSDNPADLGISYVAIYKRQINLNHDEVAGKMYGFWENQLPKFFELLNNAQRIIGFNNLKFDNMALLPYSPIDLAKLPNFDIYLEVKKTLGKSLSLDSLTRATLNRAKSDTGANAVNYFKSNNQSDLEKLADYCQKDVLLTRDLYDYVIKNKNLKFIDKWNRVQSFKVDFSYPPDFEKTENQIKLF